MSFIGTFLTALFALTAASAEAAKPDRSVRSALAKRYRETAKTVSQNEINAAKNADAIAKTLWAEARGESHTGRLGVASVIYNRAKRSGESFHDVCLKPKQFSCWNAGPVSVRVRTPEDRKIWEDCVLIAASLVGGVFKPTTSADHYYNPDLADPGWGGKLVSTEQIGNHLFGELHDGSSYAIRAAPVKRALAKAPSKRRSGKRVTVSPAAIAADSGRGNRGGENG